MSDNFVESVLASFAQKSPPGTMGSFVMGSEALAPDPVGGPTPLSSLTYLDPTMLSGAVAGPLLTRNAAVSSVSSAYDLLFDRIRKDFYFTRERMLHLNSSRREWIERRLETLARRMARVRGDKIVRSFSLQEVLRDSFKAAPKEKSLQQLALEAFSGEVAFHQILEISLLKFLDTLELRPFQRNDLNCLNFAIHSFLSHKTVGFNSDRSSWNFVRPNIYSWYALSDQAADELWSAGIFHPEASTDWSDSGLQHWLDRQATLQKEVVPLMERPLSEPLCRSVWEFVETILGMPLLTSFQGRKLSRKVFFSSLEGHRLALRAFHSLLDQSQEILTRPLAKAGENESYLHHALWASEAESLETHYCEVQSLLALLREAGKKDVFRKAMAKDPTGGLFKLPHGVRIAPHIALELHTQVQLALSQGPSFESSASTAHQIQQNENFDLSFVFDSPDKARSGRWLKALADQLPYWRGMISSNTNLNWGELHLHLALTKLREGGICLFFSHKLLGDGGDADKLRRTLLNAACLDFLLEIDPPADDAESSPYRYLYVFTKESQKSKRDLHRIRFGRLHYSPHLKVEANEINSTQWEVLERGWDQVHVRGAASLVRHLTFKFPKLFQVASTLTGPSQREAMEGLAPHSSLFSSPHSPPLEVLEVRKEDAGRLLFVPVQAQYSSERVCIVPHNRLDLPWLQSVLNSSPVQFWIRMQILQDSTGFKSQFRPQDLRSIPIVDLSKVHPERVAQDLSALTVFKNDSEQLGRWASALDREIMESRFVALTRYREQLSRSLARSVRLFDQFNQERAELNPERALDFYPRPYMDSLRERQDVRIFLQNRDACTSAPALWLLRDVSVIEFYKKDPSGQGGQSLITVQTKQGPQIQLLVDQRISHYVASQLRHLRDFMWSEALDCLLIPQDPGIFFTQYTEIVKKARRSQLDIQNIDSCLDSLVMALFEIPMEDRQYLRNLEGSHR